MWKCMRCGKSNIDTVMKCQCGFDSTMNYLAYYTLTPLSAQERIIKKLEEKPVEKVEPPKSVVTPPQTPVQPVGRKKKSRGKWVAAIAFFGVIGAIVSLREDAQRDALSQGVPELVYEEYESAEATGEHFKSTYGYGEYVVGVIIPVGSYTCYLEEASYYATIQVIDPEMGEEQYIELDYQNVPSVSLVELKEGQIVKVWGAEVCFESPNALVQSRNATANLEQQVFDIWNGAAAGQDFEAGVYEVQLTDLSEDAVANFYIEDANGYVLNWGYLSADQPVYRNCVIPEGAKISMDVESLELISSLIIKNGDYTGYYNYIY